MHWAPQVNRSAVLHHLPSAIQIMRLLRIAQPYCQVNELVVLLRRSLRERKETRKRV